MTMEFNDWTAYDNWLVQNYDEFSVYNINEANGKIVVEYCPKAEFPEIRNKDYKKPERRI